MTRGRRAVLQMVEKDLVNISRTAALREITVGSSKSLFSHDHLNIVERLTVLYIR